MKYFEKASFLLFLILCVNNGNSEETTNEKNDIPVSKGIRTVTRTMLGVGGKFVPFFDAVLTLWDGIEELSKSGEKTDTDAKVDRLASKIDKMYDDMTYYYNDLDATLTMWDINTGQLYPKLRDVYKSVRELEGKFDHMIKIIENNYTYNLMKTDLASVRLDIPKIRAAVVSEWVESRDYKNVLELLHSPTAEPQQVCSKIASVQQVLHNHYRSVHGALVKGLWLLVFAYEKEKEYQDNEKQAGIRVASIEHFNAVMNITNLFKNYMEQVSRDMWRCDPNTATEGKTYERFGRAFQKYLINMRNVQPPGKFNWEDCPGSCEGIPGRLDRYRGHFWSLGEPDLPPSYLASINLGNYSESIQANKELQRHHMHSGPKRHHCNHGFLKDCKTIWDSKLQICPAQLNATERYVYMKGGNWEYGTKTSCLNNPVEIQRAPSIYIENTIFSLRFNANFQVQRENKRDTYVCRYCMCTCEYNSVVEYSDTMDPPVTYEFIDTDRYIDLNTVVADEGHVVTGVRLTKIKETYTFHLQIKQAKLLANGRVEDAVWKKVITYYPAKTRDNLHTPEYREGVDYHTIKYDNTVIHLNDELPEDNGQVLTGVRFQVHTEESGKVHLRLVSKLSRCNFTSGNISEIEGWHPKTAKMMLQRDQVDVEELDLPTRFNGRNKIFTKRPSYVKLANSGLKVDVGQNVLPFIDIQPVDTQPPVPLASISLHHRGFKGSGGYLGLKASIIDITRYLPTEEKILEEQHKLTNMISNMTFDSTDSKDSSS